MLQHLIAAREIEKATEEGFRSEEEIPEPEEPRLPNLLLAIEEPKLYQHPSRQRHMASVLLRLAEGSVPGVAKKTQVIYSTHAPPFVGLDRFDQIRLFRKEDKETGRPKVTKVAKAELEAVAEEIWKAPKAKVAVYVGTGWDPQEGSETPWIDMPRQLADEEGVKALGPRAKDDPPGGDTLNRIFEMAGGRVLLLFDEVLNGFSRHKWLAEPIHAFFHVLVRTLVGSQEKSAVFSLPRSQVEPTPPTPEPEPGPGPAPGPGPGPAPPTPSATVIRVSGNVPPELWNRLGTRVLPKLRSGDDLKIGVSLEVSVDTPSAEDLRAELRQILGDLGLEGAVTVE